MNIGNEDYNYKIIKLSGSFPQSYINKITEVLIIVNFIIKALI